MAAVVIDLDHFKRINDGKGHAAGDAVLRAVAQLLSERVRQSDIACRYGGEEFVILMPGASAAMAARRAEDWLAAIRCLAVSHGDTFITGLTASAGVAAFDEHGDDYPEVFAAADLALYLAKGSGRDRVVVASAPERRQLEQQHVGGRAA